MAKRKGNCKKYGRSKTTGKCRKAHRVGRKGSKLHKRGRHIGGEYKVACNGKRVYASTSESSAKDAARAASKRMGSCLVYTGKGRVASFKHGSSV
jgi:hypothetical protein